MIQAKKLGHIVLRVRDASKSRDFYTRTLGLKVAHEDVERGAVFLRFGEAHHDLALFQPATAGHAGPPHTGLLYRAWQLGCYEALAAPYGSAATTRRRRGAVAPSRSSAGPRACIRHRRRRRGSRSPTTTTRSSPGTVSWPKRSTATGASSSPS